jgi:hypothetical protein
MNMVAAPNDWGDLNRHGHYEEEITFHSRGRGEMRLRSGSQSKSDLILALEELAISLLKCTI